MAPLRPDLPTLTDVFATYADEYFSDLAPVTRYQHARLYQWFRAELEPEGPRPLAALTAARLEAWIQTLLGRLAPSTVRRYLDILRVPLQVAVERHWLAANPLDSVVKPPGPPARLRLLTPDEHQRLLAACQSQPNPHLYGIVVLVLSTGLRTGELTPRVWGDIDIEAGRIRLPRTPRIQARVVRCLGCGLALLRQRAATEAPRRTDLVFPGTHSRQAPIRIDHAWGRAVAEADLGDLHLHDLRHTAASYLALAGASLQEIQMSLGLTSARMTRRYLHCFVPPPDDDRPRLGPPLRGRPYAG